MRLIDADALHISAESFCRNVRSEKIHISGIHAMIENAPTIDAEPVRHGHWVRHTAYDDFDVCTACGTGCRRRFVEDGGITEYGYIRCPHCGAKMDAADTDVHTREVSE